MQVGIVGGLERTERQYEDLAAHHGHRLVFHHGHVHGAGLRSLRQLVDHSDVVILITDVNSHAAVQITRRLMREQGRSPVIMRRCGTARLALFFAEQKGPPSIGDGAVRAVLRTTGA